MRKAGRTLKGLRAFGHPLHAMLVHLPLGLWALVFPLETAGLLGGWEVCWRLAFLANAGGLIGSVPAALAGAADLAALDGKGKPASLGLLHMGAMGAAASLFGLELLLRGGMEPVALPMAIANLGLSLGASLLLAWGGWLGGEMVFRHGVGASGADAEKD
jgi:uncharacterized membrane protein